MRLRSGDTVDFVITASDPLGAALQYSMNVGNNDLVSWQDSNIFSVTFSDMHVGKNVVIRLIIQSPRRFHALDWWDDVVSFIYDLLPRKEDAA
jgi:hypothetical protein